MVEKKPKPKYELEELLKVRERTKDVEDVVRKISNSECGDHILRSINETSIRSQRVRNSSIITNPWEKEEAHVRGGAARVRSGRQSKYSPTPSMKRGKAERLLKEHGSPPGIRVTAGGRIVPDGLSPLTSPRFDANFQAKRGFYNHGALQSGSSLRPYHGWVINLGDGNIGQIVDGDVRPVPLRNGTLQLYMPAPNLPPQPPFFPVGPAMAPLFSPLYGPPAMISPPLGFDPNQSALSSLAPSARELRLLEQFQSNLEQELKDLNRNEVLQRGSLNQRKREDIVKRRIELTEQIDQSRRSISEAKKVLADSDRSQPTALSTGRRAFQQPLQPSLVFQAASRGVGSQVPQQHFPEFVPRNFTVPSTGNEPTNEALRERSSNGGLGSATSPADGNGSSDTIKPSVSGVMGLDGSVHQPRRSHAIAIKAPNEASVNPGASLNPASPSYRPKRTTLNGSESIEQSEVLSFMPSPSLIAQMETLVRSPTQEERHLDGSVDTQQRSESSVNTIDFFPQNTQQYSSKYKHDAREQDRTTSWMPKEGDPLPQNTHSTPVRPPNKFIYANDSPAEGHWSGISDPMRLSHDAQDAPPSNAERAHMRESTTVTDDNRYGRGQRYLVPTPQLLSEVSQRAAQLLTDEVQGSSIAYKAGFETGYRQDIISENPNEEFRRGYRDGMLRSMVIQSDQPDIALAQDASGQHANALGYDRRPLADVRAPNLSSRPYNEEGATSPVPVVPANSLATTPTRARSARKEISSSALDSPSARADFEAQPNVSISAGRATRAQAASFAHPPTSTVSPSKRSFGEVSPPEQKYIAIKMRDLRESFDQQRYAKATTSVSQSNDQARGFSSQYDGSGQDENNMNARTGFSSPTSPGALTTKTKANGSPVRRKASAAVATMKQVAGISGRRDDMSPRMSPKKSPEGEIPVPTSPEKRAWREKWTRNFRQVKRDEQDDESNKHPLR